MGEGGEQRRRLVHGVVGVDGEDQAAASTTRSGSWMLPRSTRRTPPGKRVAAHGRDLRGQSCLAHSARSGQGDEPMISQVAVATFEPRPCDR